MSTSFDGGNFMSAEMIKEYVESNAGEECFRELIECVDKSDNPDEVYSKLEDMQFRNPDELVRFIES